VSHHLRVSSIASVRASLGLTASRIGGKQREHRIRSLDMSDAEGKDVRISWTDGKVGRLRIGVSGVVERCIVIGTDGRERAVERILAGGNRRIEDLGERLRRT
jgi:central kinetochore subunit Mal2/MCM21